MRLIKDGSVSGTLPTSQAFAIHYPGYPSSMDRAIQTLGGTDGIIKARSSQTNRLELRFRPEDPYSHPAFGTLRHCNNFLLKISRRKDERSPDQNEGPPNHMNATDQEVNPNQSEVVAAAPEDKENFSEEVQEDLSADIVAQVSEVYLFNGMVDYQHVLALHADETRRKKRSWEDIQPKLEKHGLMDVDQDDLLILVPPLFSNKDRPDNIVLKPSVTLSAKKKQESVVQQRWEMEIEPSLAIDFNIKVVPSSVYWEKYITKDSEQWNWQMNVSKLFEERPIWIKASLISRLLKKGLQFRGHLLRRLLFRVAYYFSNGPFQRFWIRKGYDPRKDPESRIYQRIDFRVPPSLRGFCDANVDTGKKLRWEDICAFQVFPFKCQVYLQLAELKDDFIQKEIGKPVKQKICSLETGWFSASCMKSLRLKIAVRFLSVYPKAGAESLLKFKSDNFAKSKRKQIHAKDSVSDEGQKISNPEVVDNGDKEEANEEDEEEDNDDDGGDDDDEDDEEEEEEIDLDNVEDDGLEQYEELNLDDRINRITQQEGNSNMDNESISKNYLQDLFGSFPPSSEIGSSGLNLQDGDNSDEEYQIYEPYDDDDDNYSDDDY